MRGTIENDFGMMRVEKTESLIDRAQIAAVAPAARDYACARRCELRHHLRAKKSLSAGDNNSPIVPEDILCHG